MQRLQHGQPRAQQRCSSTPFLQRAVKTELSTTEARSAYYRFIPECAKPVQTPKVVSCTIRQSQQTRRIYLPQLISDNLQDHTRHEAHPSSLRAILHTRPQVVQKVADQLQFSVSLHALELQEANPSILGALNDGRRTASGRLISSVHNERSLTFTTNEALPQVHHPCVLFVGWWGDLRPLEPHSKPRSSSPEVTPPCDDRKQAPVERAYQHKTDTRSNKRLKLRTLVQLLYSCQSSSVSTKGELPR
jgi:hypothetical protein